MTLVENATDEEALVRDLKRFNDEMAGSKVPLDPFNEWKDAHFWENRESAPSGYSRELRRRPSHRDRHRVRPAETGGDVVALRGWLGPVAERTGGHSSRSSRSTLAALVLALSVGSTYADRMSKPKAKVGRPKLYANRADRANIFFRVTSSERDELEKAAVRAGKDHVSEWAKDSLLRLARSQVP